MLRHLLSSVRVMVGVLRPNSVNSNSYHYYLLFRAYVFKRIFIFDGIDVDARCVRICVSASFRFVLHIISRSSTIIILIYLFTYLFI